MNNKEKTLNKLDAFIKKDKFSNAAWEQRGLNPSDSEMCRELQNLFNNCASKLIEAIRADANSKQSNRILKSYLKSIHKIDYDTEEREFIGDYFDQLSKIVFVDFKDSLNRWLYGNFLGTLLKLTLFFKGKEKVLAILSQNCTNCGSKLETFILRKEDGIADHSWKIIQCDDCKEFNLLSTGPNIKELRLGNYKLIEELSKTAFTEEQANIRLQQIIFFRKK